MRKIPFSKKYAFLLPLAVFGIMVFLIIWQFVIGFVPFGGNCGYALMDLGEVSNSACTFKMAVWDSCQWGRIPLLCSSADEAIFTSLMYPGMLFMKIIGQNGSEIGIGGFIASLAVYSLAGLCIDTLKQKIKVVNG